MVLVRVCILTHLRLEEILVGGRLQSGDVNAADGDSERGTGSSGDALERDGLSLGLGGLALDVVLNAASEEGIARGRLLQVLNADVDLLLNDAGVDALVQQNTDGTGGNVPDDSGLSVVVLVGHTLVDLSGSLHINDVSDVEGREVGREVSRAVLSVGDGELVAGARAVTMRVRHLHSSHIHSKQIKHPR